MDLNQFFIHFYTSKSIPPQHGSIVTRVLENQNQQKNPLHKLSICHKLAPAAGQLLA